MFSLLVERTRGAMTDEEKVLSVTSKLTGQFYVGQRVRVCNPVLSSFGEVGTVIRIIASWIDVHMDDAQGSTLSLLPTSIEPLL